MNRRSRQAGKACVAPVQRPRPGFGRSIAGLNAVVASIMLRMKTESLRKTDIRGQDRLEALPSTSLLDTGALPIAELAAFTDREAYRPRPAYLVHKWFARRFGTAMRALLVGAATP